ncbi:MAG TPA: hypothetical protein VFT72_04115 [Opitutaceae bacterium]|nr:hypothetical protein [Opitutaceae bacterium]
MLKKARLPLDAVLSREKTFPRRYSMLQNKVWRNGNKSVHVVGHNKK